MDSHVYTRPDNENTNIQITFDFYISVKLHKSSV